MRGSSTHAFFVSSQPTTLLQNQRSHTPYKSRVQCLLLLNGRPALSRSVSDESRRKRRWCSLSKRIPTPLSSPHVRTITHALCLDLSPSISKVSTRPLHARPESVSREGCEGTVVVEAAVSPLLAPPGPVHATDAAAVSPWRVAQPQVERREARRTVQQQSSGSTTACAADGEGRGAARPLPCAAVARWL